MTLGRSGIGGLRGVPFVLATELVAGFWNLFGGVGKLGMHGLIGNTDRWVRNLITILPTGTNLASITAAFLRLGHDVRMAGTENDVFEASHLAMPGVGSFDSTMEWIVGYGDALRYRIADNRPTLAICVGMQILFDGSDEGKTPGLGIIPGRVEKFPDDTMTPHIGRNKIKSDWMNGMGYFANSYAATSAVGWETATSNHASPFIAAVRHGDILGCQFHPELSGQWGSDIIEGWL